MKKYLFLALLAAGCWLLAAGMAFAQTLTPAPLPASQTVKASVGKYYFSVYGFASSFASIVMRTNSYFLGSTVADPYGNFAIKDILVNEGFSDFCFETIDVKRIGDSYACIKIKPLMANGEMRGIFLPPTLGLSGKSIRMGSSVFASGYSMPGAEIRIKLGKGLFIDAKADENGFYKTEIKDLATGKYQLFAGAYYQNKNSEAPLKGKELNSLSIPEVIIQNLPKIIIFVLIVLLIIILLIILISKRVRRRIKEFLMEKGLIRRKVEKKTLHHEWFIGF